MQTQAEPTLDPSNAPLARRLLGLRVLALNSVVIFGVLQFVHWLSDQALKLPHWLETTLKLSPVLAGCSFLITAVAAGADLLVHLLPGDDARRLFRKGGRTPQELAAGFARVGYWFALSPIALAGVAVLVAFSVVLVAGVYLLVAGAISSVLSG